MNYIYWVFYDVLFLKYLIESLETGKSFEEIMTFILFAMLGFAIPNALSAWYTNIYKPKSDADFYNRFTLAMKDCEQRLAQILENQCVIFSSSIASVFALYYMFTIDHYVIFFIAGSLIGNFVFGKMINELKFRMNKECVPYNRKMEYVNRTLYLADYAKEFRMSEVFSVLKKLYEEDFQGVLGKIKEYRNRNAFYDD